MAEKRKRTITIDADCQFVKNLKNKQENAEEQETLRAARQSKLALKNQINDLEEKLDSLDDKVLDAKSTLPLDANTILNAEDEIKLAERRLSNAKALYEELFNEVLKD